MKIGELVINNYKQIASLYEVLASITELRENEENLDIRRGYTCVLVDIENAIESLVKANEALEEC